MTDPAHGIDHRPLWSQRITQLRRAKRWSQTEAINELRKAAAPEILADTESLRKKWKRWENGETKGKPRPATQRHLAKAFGVDPSVIFDDRGPVSELVVVTDPTSIELLERTRRADLDQASLDALGLAIDQMCSDYSAMLPTDLLAESRSWLRLLDGLYDARHSDRQRLQLGEMHGWLALLIGSLEFDLDDLRQAEMIRRYVDRLGHETNNDEIRAWARELQAWLALNNGRYGDVVSEALAGQAMAPNSPVAAQLAGHEAEAFARLGDRQAAEQALGKLLVYRAQMPEPEMPRHHFKLEPSKFDKVEMRLLSLFGEHDRAVDVAEQILAMVGGPEHGKMVQPMITAKAITTIGVRAATEGELDEAVARGHEALDIPRQTIPSLVASVSDLRDALQPMEDEAPVRELDERIAELRASAA